MTLKQVIAQLKHRKIALVAKHTGLSRQAIYNIVSGKCPSPRLDTFNKLVAYLKSV